MLKSNEKVDKRPKDNLHRNDSITLNNRGVCLVLYNL